jgi:hypothetical protein
MKRTIMLMLICIGLAGVVQAQTPSPTPEQTRDELIETEKALRAELESLKAEARSEKYQAILDKAIRTARAVQERERKRLEELRSQLADANKNTAELRAEILKLKADLKERDKTIADLKKQQRRTRKKLITVGVFAAILGVIAIAK